VLIIFKLSTTAGKTLAAKGEIGAHSLTPGDERAEKVLMRKALLVSSTDYGICTGPANGRRSVRPAARGMQRRRCAPQAAVACDAPFPAAANLCRCHEPPRRLHPASFGKVGLRMLSRPVT
jgi:hypothetical protein